MATELSGCPQDYGWKPHKPESWTHKFADLKESKVLQHYLGYWKDGQAAMRDVPLEAGHPIKIVMVSRFGDVGITEDLDSENGYGLRVRLDDLCNFGSDR